MIATAPFCRVLCDRLVGDRAGALAQERAAAGHTAAYHSRAVGRGNGRRN